MHTQTETKKPSLDLEHLPAYAQYLLTHRLEELVQLQRSLALEENLPLLQQVAHLDTDAQLSLLRLFTHEQLSLLSENRAAEWIELSIRHWLGNEFPFDRYALVSEDIIKINYIRKKTFLHFLQAYCLEGAQMLHVIEDIDRFHLHYGTEVMAVFNRIMQEHLHSRETQLLEAQAIAHIGSYQWDLETGQSSITPELTRILEVENDTQAFLMKVHPDDRARVESELKVSLATGDFNSEFRYQNSQGLRYLWSRGKVHYRDGKAATVTGTVLDITDRELLHERAQENERLYRLAEELAQMGNWCWDPADGKLSWTDNLYRIYGLEPQSEEMTLDRFLSLVHPADRERIAESLRKGFPEDAEDHTFRILRPDGTLRVLHSLARVKRGADGQLLQVYGTEKDVTEQHATEQALKDNQNFLRKLADATPSIISSYNINTGVYTFVSEGVEKILGYTPLQVYEGGTAFMGTLVHPDDREALQSRNERILEEANLDPQSEPVAEFRYRVRHKNGSWRWLQTFGTVFDRNEQGLVENVLNISLDITAQMEAQHKIEEQEYFIQQIADASPMVLYLFDIGSGRFHYLNREIFYVLGYTPEEVLEMTPEEVNDLYHPEDRGLPPERAGSGSHFQYHESMMQYECRLRKKDGSWYWLLAREIVFRKDADGRVLQILGAALDINRRKEMERTLLQNAFQLEQSNASLEEFAYVASHDLKEPLRKISTFGDRLMDSQMERLSEDGKIYLRKVVDASQRMQAMIDDLLSVSRISGNRSFEETSLQSLLNDALAALEHKIEQKGALIKVEEALPPANVVPSQFRQLFQNLLSNSIKFAREGVPPVIHIRYRYRHPDEVPAGVAKASSYLELEFSDNGIGFEPEYAGKIFQIFQRLHGRSEYEGNGIGLAIVKKIAEHHGGTIFATGTPEQGAVFTLILPL